MRHFEAFMCFHWFTCLLYESISLSTKKTYFASSLRRKLFVTALKNFKNHHLLKLLQTCFNMKSHFHLWNIQNQQTCINNWQSPVSIMCTRAHVAFNNSNGFGRVDIEKKIRELSKSNGKNLFDKSCLKVLSPVLTSVSGLNRIFHLCRARLFIMNFVNCKSLPFNRRLLCSRSCIQRFEREWDD